VRRFKKFMCLTSLVTIFFFNMYVTPANAFWDGTFTTSAVTLANASPVLITGAGYSAAVSASGMSLLFNPYVTAGVTILAVAAAGYLAYSHFNGDPGTVNGDGSVSVPASVQWVDLSASGAPELNVMKGGNANVAGTDLQAGVGTTAAEQAQYPNLYHALYNNASPPQMTYPVTVGSVYSGPSGDVMVDSVITSSTDNSAAGQTIEVYKNYLYYVGDSADSYHPWYNPLSKGYINLDEVYVHPVNPPIPSPIDISAFASALLPANSSATTGPMDSQFNAEINDFVNNNMNVVHFDPLPASVQPASAAAIKSAAGSPSTVAAAAANTAAAATASTASTTQANATAAAAAASSAATAANATAASTLAAASAANAAAANDPTNTTLAAAATSANNAANAAQVAAALAANQAQQAQAASDAANVAAAAANAAATGNGLLASILGVLTNFFDTVTQFITDYKAQRASDDAAISSTALPSPPVQGNYSGAINPASLPAKQDIGASIKTFVAASPLIGMVKGLAVSATNDTSVISYDFHGRTITADFNKYDSYVAAAGTALLVIVHGLAVLIVFRKE